MFKRTLITIIVSLTLLALASTSFAQGRKMGVFVGISQYQDGIGDLDACVNDAIKMREKLSNNYGFSRTDTTLLTNGEATRQGILNQLQSYEQKVSSGDIFVFYYSGHGSIYPDRLSAIQDETEMFAPPDVVNGYYDSTLVPVDARRQTSGKPWGNKILDDELNEIFSRFTSKGVQVIFISDSCHAGTLAKNLVKKNTTKFVSPALLGFNTKEWNQVAKIKGRKITPPFNKLFLVVGSSQDNQFSDGANPETGTQMSLFTYIFLKTLESYEKANQSFTYQTIVSTVNPLVDKVSGGEQTPRLDDRFFDASLLDRPIFSLLNGSSVAGNRNLRIVIKVTDDNGNPISEANFGVLPVGVKADRTQLSKSDVLILGKTNAKGLYDSSSTTLPAGNYQIKVVKQGYKAFIKEMNVTESKNGVSVFVFKLVRE